jgi:hypothetical protein
MGRSDGIIAFGLLPGEIRTKLTCAWVRPDFNPVRPTPPTRDPHTAGYVAAKELPDNTNPPATVDGNFIIGPTYDRPPEMSETGDTPQGVVFEFTMNSTDSKIYPGIAREPNTFGTPDPTDPAKLVVTTSHPAPYTRKVTVYIPKQYVTGSVAPFIVALTRHCSPRWISSSPSIGCRL